MSAFAYFFNNVNKNKTVFPNKQPADEIKVSLNKKQITLSFNQLSQSHTL